MNPPSGMEVVFLAFTIVPWLFVAWFLVRSFQTMRYHREYMVRNSLVQQDILAALQRLESAGRGTGPTV
jgi:hypothetical protein